MKKTEFTITLAMIIVAAVVLIYLQSLSTKDLCRTVAGWAHTCAMSGVSREDMLKRFDEIYKH